MIKKILPVCFILVTGTSYANDSSQELAEKLNNPIAALISVPFQYNYDSHVGTQKGEKNTLKIQPVIPFQINDDTNIISRSIIPLIEQHNTTSEHNTEKAVGDITQSFFYSPKAPTSSGWVWGVGTALLIPTGSDLSSDSWGAGPTVVALKKSGPWSYGVLANHIWDYAGSSNRDHISDTYIQPFVHYTLPTATSFGINTESTYDWRKNQWSVPVNFTVTQVVKTGKHVFQVGVGARYWAVSDDEHGPKGWGVRANITFLFPK